MRILVLTFLLLVSLVSTGFAATPDRLAVVDIEKIMLESKPGKLGQAHMEEVQKILNAAFEKAVALNKEKAKSIEDQIAAAAKDSKLEKPQPFDLQRVVQQDHALLQRELQAQTNAVRAEIVRLIKEGVAKWLKRNGKYGAVFPMGVALGNTEDADETKAIMEYVNEMKPTFPDLPSVQIADPNK